MRHLIRAAAMAAAVLLTAGRAAAQIDYRNLDDGRPVHTEDAYPVERYAFELVTVAGFENDASGVHAARLAPELEYGAFMNGQVGLSAPVGLVRGPGASGLGDLGLAGVRLHALYNFNSEGRALPAIALRTDLSLPVGSLAGDPARVTVKAIATRSWGLTRAHVNATWSFGAEDGLAEGAAPRWSLSLAADRTLFRSSLLFVAEGLLEQAVRYAPTVATLAAGVRWQWSPTLVLDAGIGRRLSSDGPDFAVSVGVSRAFGIRALLPAGRR